MNKNDKKLEFALAKENYKLLLIGFAIIIIGFLLMMGGGSEDPNVFDEDILASAELHWHLWLFFSDLRSRFMLL